MELCEVLAAAPGVATELGIDGSAVATRGRAALGRASMMTRAPWSAMVKIERIEPRDHRGRSWARPGARMA